MNKWPPQEWGRWNVKAMPVCVSLHSSEHSRQILSHQGNFAICDKDCGFSFSAWLHRYTFNLSPPLTTVITASSRSLILLYFRCRAVNSNPVPHNQQRQKKKEESNWAVKQKQCPLVGVAALRVETDMIYSWLCLFLVLSSRTWWNVWQLYSPQEGVNDWE